MRPPSLTARIALLFAVAAAAVLGVLGVVLARAVQAHFEEMDRHELAGKIELVGNLLARIQGRRELDALPQRLDDALVGHPGLAVLVIDAGGRIWYATSGADFPRPLLEAARGDSTPLLTWTRQGRPYRGLAARTPVALGGGPYTVAVALDIGHHDRFMAEFRRTLYLWMGLAALATAALGWLVTRRGLAPLRRMGATAASLSASRLAERLPEAAAPAELAELAGAFNQMLARLEESFRRLADFSSDLAHELRTPLSNLMTQAQVALSRARSAEEYREALESALEEYERLARMVSDMLFLAQADNRLVVPRREAIDLAAVVRRLLDFHEALAEEAGVRLAMTGEARVEGDRLMLERAVANLIGNAIRHTPRGGTVEVALDADAQGVRIAVDNPGPDIPPEHLPRLFDRFYRADPARPDGAHHAGLGLAIVRSIAEAHGGSVRAESSGGRTRFEMCLPAA